MGDPLAQTPVPPEVAASQRRANMNVWRSAASTAEYPVLTPALAAVVASSHSPETLHKQLDVGGS